MDNHQKELTRAIDKKLAELKEELKTIENTIPAVEEVSHLKVINKRLITSIKKHNDIEASLDLSYTPRLTLYFKERIYTHEEVKDGAHSYDRPDYYGNSSTIIYFDEEKGYTDILDGLNARIKGITTSTEKLEKEKKDIDTILAEHGEIIEKGSAFASAYSYTTKDACKKLYY